MGGFRRNQQRERRAVQFSRRNDMGETRQDLHRSSYRETVSAHYAVGGLGQGGAAIHNLAGASMSVALFIKFLSQLIAHYP
jgi:hypothetical protein